MDNLIAATQDKLWIMGDNYNRFTRSSQPVDCFCYLPHMIKVKPAGGLVKEDNGPFRIGFYLRSRSERKAEGTLRFTRADFITLLILLSGLAG